MSISKELANELLEDQQIKATDQLAKLLADQRASLSLDMQQMKEMYESGYSIEQMASVKKFRAKLEDATLQHARRQSILQEAMNKMLAPAAASMSKFALLQVPLVDFHNLQPAYPNSKLKQWKTL